MGQGERPRSISRSSIVEPDLRTQN